MTTAIYPGSFDPVTMGHLDIIRRSARIFSHVYVAVAQNPHKKPDFSLEQRRDYLLKVTRDLDNVEVITIDGLLVEAAQKRNARIIIKGLRAMTDFEYEFQMALMNKKLGNDVETLFMATSTKYSFLSSSLVKEVARLGGCIDGLVPEEVREDILAQLRR
ncbi:MAG: pantetheine-phosphate adenylyltransferase [Firmicutes bacterium]|nr:pantetheine-phosphate adenylyltransferase [Bacillota bacterium]HOB35229.1 pantetheine-phosphate adenylyltransferase [Bacillota bacterium]HPZ89875.1 pantetheine-phosphate adenylyltransferase [Bacillota bacterium]HQE01109.1 pantetheine-phosphate adenylyltransferase [Bacillota bacterium]